MVTQQAIKAEGIERGLTESICARICRQLTIAGEIEPHKDNRDHNRVSYSDDHAEKIRAAFAARVGEESPSPPDESNDGGDTVDELAHRPGPQRQPQPKAPAKPAAPTAANAGGKVKLSGNTLWIIGGVCVLIFGGLWLAQRRRQKTPPKEPAATMSPSPTARAQTGRSLVDKWTDRPGFEQMRKDIA